MTRHATAILTLTDKLCIVAPGQSATTLSGSDHMRHFSTTLRRPFAVALLLAISTLASGRTLQAQADIRVVLGSVIWQLQNGFPNPNWYGPQLWTTMAVQTGNSGVYPPLRQAGVATRIDLLKDMRLPLGSVFFLTSHHQAGAFLWEVGVNGATNRIEYLTFQPAPRDNPPTISTRPPATPTDNPTTPTGGSDAPAPKVPPSSGPASDEACRKFPLLCS